MTDKDNLSGLTVKMPVRWPWDIKIVTSAGDDLLTLQMPCHSTSDKTLDDVMSGKCWGKKEDRENAAKWNAEQVKLAHRIAAAGELLDAVKLCAAVLSGEEMSKSALCRALDAAAKSIKKADGEQHD